MLPGSANQDQIAPPDSTIACQRREAIISSMTEERAARCDQRLASQTHYLRRRREVSEVNKVLKMQQMADMMKKIAKVAAA